MRKLRKKSDSIEFCIPNAHMGRYDMETRESGRVHRLASLMYTAVNNKRGLVSINVEVEGEDR